MRDSCRLYIPMALYCKPNNNTSRNNNSKRIDNRRSRPHHQTVIASSSLKVNMSHSAIFSQMDVHPTPQHQPPSPERIQPINRTSTPVFIEVLRNHRIRLNDPMFLGQVLLREALAIFSRQLYIHLLNEPGPQVPKEGKMFLQNARNVRCCRRWSL